jgi:hypothetical protein
LTDTALAPTLTDGSYCIETKAAVANTYVGRRKFPECTQAEFFEEFFIPVEFKKALITAI